MFETKVGVGNFQLRVFVFRYLRSVISTTIRTCFLVTSYLVSIT